MNGNEKYEKETKILLYMIDIKHKSTPLHLYLFNGTVKSINQSFNDSICTMFF